MMEIDLSLFPAPNVIEILSYEVILARNIASLQKILPDWQPLESDMYMPYLEESTYRELMLRKRVNDASHGNMLAYASGSDLDQIGGNRETVRLAGESDAVFRNRIQKAFNTLAAAGPAAAYIEHARGIDASIVDVSAISPSDGAVTITVLAPEFILTSIATPDQQLAGQAAFPSVLPPSGSSVIVANDHAPLVNKVRTWLAQDTIKPLTDVVVVRGATVLSFTIAATLTFYPGPDSNVVITDAHAALDKYLTSIRRMGFDATRSSIVAALSVPGVQRVDLQSPTGDVVADSLSIALATSITLNDGGRNV